jgi:hypothetical protein
MQYFCVLCTPDVVIVSPYINYELPMTCFITLWWDNDTFVFAFQEYRAHVVLLSICTGAALIAVVVMETEHNNHKTLSLLFSIVTCCGL